MGDSKTTQIYNALSGEHGSARASIVFREGYSVGRALPRNVTT